MNLSPKDRAASRRPPRHVPGAAPTAVLALVLTFCTDASGNDPNVAPQAVFTPSCADLSCAFIDGSTDPDGAIVSRSWSFGDGSPASDVPSHTYAAAGTYTVTLTVTDDAGADDVFTQEVTVSAPVANTPPVSAFTSSCNALTCRFTDGSTDADGTIVSRSWNFGDGSTSAEVHPEHTYAQSGRYSVSLTVNDDDEASSSSSHDITLEAADVIFVGAGDIADCGSSAADEETADLIDALPSATVFTLGDNVYGNATASQYADCYHPSWGRHKARTRPAPGNQEYNTPNATGYYGYFGAAAGDPDKGYYSYDLGAWHVIVLNSEVPMSRGSAQEQWLRADLAANPTFCTLAYWHHSRFSSGPHGSLTRSQALWDALYQAGADVILGAHDHTYERFAPQTPTGAPDPARGIRQFVVGTGGKGVYYLNILQPNSEVFNATTFGVLKLTLSATGYAWEFLPIEGSSFTDAGTGECH